MTEIAIDRSITDDPYLNLWPDFGKYFDVGVLLKVKKEIKSDTWGGTASVLLMRTRKVIENVLLPIPAGISENTFMGMIPESKEYMTELKTYEKTGKLNLKNPTLVLVGFLLRHQAVIICYYPAKLDGYFTRTTNKFRKLKQGEPYIRAKSKSAIHMDNEKNTWFRLDDTLPDSDPNNLVVQVDKDRNITVTNFKTLKATGTDNIDVKIGKDNNVEIGGNVTIKVVGTSTINVTGAAEVNAEATVKVTAKGNVDVLSDQIVTLKSQKDSTQAVPGLCLSTPNCSLGVPMRIFQSSVKESFP